MYSGWYVRECEKRQCERRNIEPIAFNRAFGALVGAGVAAVSMVVLSITAITLLSIV